MIRQPNLTAGLPSLSLVPSLIWQGCHFLVLGYIIYSMTFIERYGLVRYKGTHPSKLGVCEICLAVPPPATYLDHCHDHGWIRGEVCHSHNLKMQAIDAGTKFHLWEPWMLEHWQKCPDCVRTQSRALPPAPPMFDVDEALLSVLKALRAPSTADEPRPLSVGRREALAPPDLRQASAGQDHRPG
jgi:hypothetical protein